MMQERIVDFRFYPERWVHMDHIAPIIASDLVITEMLAAKIPQFDLGVFETQAGRFLLLTESEWRRLGLGIALLPYCGRLSKTIDGNLRKALAIHLSSEELTAIDALGWNDCAPTLNCWKDDQRMIWAGIENGKDACAWDPALRRYNEYRFSVSSIERATNNVTLEQMGELCKILLPDLSWL